MIIKLVRHGQSMANEVGDHTVPLTALGHQQAREAGRTIGAEFHALAYCSRDLPLRPAKAG